jgi:hypothetical protein
MKRTALLLTLLLAVAATSGCNSTSNPSGGTDLNKGLVADLVGLDESADPNLAGMNLTDEPEAADSPGRGFASLLAAIPDSVRVCWYRHLSNTSKSVEVTGDSTLMTATLVRTNVGALKGLDCSPRPWRGGGHDTTLFDKAYTVSWTRMAQFTKTAAASEDNEEDSRWKLVSTSLAHTTLIAPADAVPPQITAVTLSGRDTLGAPMSVSFTDPTLLFNPATLPLFAEGDTVRIKVFTDAPANQVAFIHFDMASSDRGRCQRRPLLYVPADGAFEGVFRIAKGHGQFHHNGRRVRSAVWVDVMTRATLRDDTAPYSATGWGVPYRMHKGHGMMAGL